MSASGLEVFDKTLQTTHIWLDDIMATIGPDRHLAWHVLGAVLRTLRDRLPLGLAAHLGSQLPILIRGTYYDQWQPREKPLELRSQDEFLEHVSQSLWNTRPVNTREATRAVFRAIVKHIDAGQVRKVVDALPSDVKALWPSAEAPQPAEMRETETAGARR
jgi:uncharacterized protein (DUF2267 family)